MQSHPFLSWNTFNFYFIRLSRNNIYVSFLTYDGLYSIWLETTTLPPTTEEIVTITNDDNDDDDDEDETVSSTSSKKRTGSHEFKSLIIAMNLLFEIF